jgi:hypothetical protein
MVVHMQGLFESVPIACGNITTFAHLFVGTSAPFDLLLGRPWQRGNMVSIDKCNEGTYLVFKDRNQMGELESKFKMMVEAEPMPSWAAGLDDFMNSVQAYDP